MRELRIGGQEVGETCEPFVIAEMSGNHGHQLEKALRLVDAAANAGVHALKLQTYTADTMTLDLNDGDFFIDDPQSLWSGHSLYDLYCKAYTPWEWHKPIFDRARQLGLLAFSTPFDLSAVDFLETLNVPCYKIASFENGDLPLIRRVAATGKPLIMSTGTATLAELEESVEVARQAGCRDLVLLKCTSNYPARAEDANLATLPFLAETFDCVVGISDHTLGTAVPVAAVALGGRVIEKHFTLDRAEGDVDAAFSLEPDELSALVHDARVAWQAVGRVCCEPLPCERATRKHRRSLYVVQDVKAGERLTPAHVRSIRPGNGLAPRYYDELIGSVATRDLPKGMPLTRDMYAT